MELKCLLDVLVEKDIIKTEYKDMTNKQGLNLIITSYKEAVDKITNKVTLMDKVDMNWDCGVTRYKRDVWYIVIVDIDKFQDYIYDMMKGSEFGTLSLARLLDSYNEHRIIGGFIKKWTRFNVKYQLKGIKLIDPKYEERRNQERQENIDFINSLP